ncbi:hypothetical protein BO99DRAFT_428006 [Aspergillus violaceofuscus CBS 115571]|uniref:Uncharacterized protein n=1 Tax=Aspergillus violaceofuscus (strain CBS 115571) TaxID=1450538 RepID=A0A2V5HQG4_ASPV1|nr:hypothetical protein BO99DRAFT_428006 [Aspergillus violaceofuscus CBS 115571]
MRLKTYVRKSKAKLRGLFRLQTKHIFAEPKPLENAATGHAEKSREKPPSPQYQGLVNGQSASANLWQRAEDILNRNRDKHQLLQSVYATLAEELGEELQPIGTARRQAQLDRLFQKRVNALEKQKWKIQFGDQAVAVQDLVNGLFEKVLVIKGLVDTAASASPPAALACAGLSVVFMLALQATSQQAILLQTLDYTSSLMCRFQVIEDVYRSGENAPVSTPGHQADLLQKFEGPTYTLPSSSDAFEHEGWDDILQNIKSLEVDTEKDAQIIGAANLAQRLRAIQSTQQYESTRQMLIDRDKKVMKLLRTLYTSPYKDRKDRNDDRVPGTCEWFTHHSLFESWHQTEGSSLLWVSADPGCGKSVLARYLVDDFLPARKEATICYFFFKDGFSDQNTATSAISAILRQVYLSNPQLLRDSILAKFGTDGDRLTRSFDDLWSIFTSVVMDPCFGEVICVLNALDWIEGVVRFSQGGLGTGNVKFLVTSRPYLDIYREFQGAQEDLSKIHLSGEGEEEIDQISKEINLATQKRVEDIARERGLTSK